MTFKSELLKSVTGRMWLWLLLGGALVANLAAFGYGAEADELGIPARISTAQIARAWMMVLLLAALLGAGLYGRDLKSGGVSRSVVVAGRRPVLRAKLQVTVLWGCLFGLFAAAMAYFSPGAILAMFGESAVWSQDSYLTVFGVFLCCPLAAAFGLYVGVLARSTVAATSIVLLAILVVEPGLQRLVPQVAKYSFSIALSAVYRDEKEHLLSQTGGVLVALGWITVLGVASHLYFQQRDVE